MGEGSIFYIATGIYIHNQIDFFSWKIEVDKYFDYLWIWYAFVIDVIIYICTIFTNQEGAKMVMKSIKT